LRAMFFLRAFFSRAGSGLHALSQTSMARDPAHQHR
jgi:hypothetical protein